MTEIIIPDKPELVLPSNYPHPPKREVPEWAKLDLKNPNFPAGCFLVDPDEAYPALLGELGIEPEEVDKYWLEVVYQFVKLDLQFAMGRNNFTIVIRGSRDYKKKWALKQHPDGKGIVAAAQGGGARAHYKRLRGFLPA